MPRLADQLACATMLLLVAELVVERVMLFPDVDLRSAHDLAAVAELFHQALDHRLILHAWVLPAVDDERGLATVRHQAVLGAAHARRVERRAQVRRG
jgi:hypothetical protein